jgi:hypothetical protein
MSTGDIICQICGLMNPHFHPPSLFHYPRSLKLDRNNLTDFDIVQRGLEDGIGKVQNEFCTHDGPCGAMNTRCSAQELHKAIAALMRIKESHS